MFKKNFSIASLAALTLVGAFALAQDATQFVGAWKGTWEGGGAGGKIEVSVQRAADGKLSGGVSVGQDTGDYVAKFTTAAVEGGEFKARYAFTPDEQADILLTAKIQDGGLNGTWTMVAKGGGVDTAFAAGTWTAKK